MLSPDLIAVMNAINAGDKARARRLLQPLLKSNPTAEAWYQAARLTEKPEHELACLRQALGLGPLHVDARRRYHELQASTSPPAQPQTAPAAPEAPTVRPAPPEPVAAPRSRPTAPIAADLPLKKVRHRRKRGTWFYVGIIAAVLMGISSTYFVLLVLGSSLPGRLLGLVSGQPPVTEIDGVPLDQVEDAVLQIEPARSAVLPKMEPKADVLEPGFVHEYTFEVMAGQEVAIGIQFFSPTAQRVSRNIAVLDSDGEDAERHCGRGRILQGDSGAAITCRIHRSGTWKLRLLGREGESSGAYVVSIENLFVD